MKNNYHNLRKAKVSYLKSQELTDNKHLQPGSSYINIKILGLQKEIKRNWLILASTCVQYCQLFYIGSGGKDVADVL